MPLKTPAELCNTKCLPCEAGVEPFPAGIVEQQLGKLTGWRLTHSGQRIAKSWVVKNFTAGIEFFQRCAALAEAESHHPDLHIEGYRNVSIEIWTHAIGGLSINDFILAAKIDELPVELQEPSG